VILPQQKGLTVGSILVAVNVKETGVANAHRERPGFALHMEVAGDAHFQDVIRVPVTSISVQPMGEVNAAKRKVATSLP